MGTKLGLQSSNSQNANPQSKARNRVSVGQVMSHSSDPEVLGSFILEPGTLSWHLSRQKSTIFTPDSMSIAIWNVWLLIIVLYDMWVMPLVLCFHVINDEICLDEWLTTTLMVLELFFVIDIYIQLHTGFYVAGNLVRNPASTRRRYTGSWNFPLDIIALIPLPFFNFASTKVCGPVVLNKLLRFRMISDYTLAFDKVFARYFTFCKVVKVVVVSFFFCHYMACIYVSFGKQSNKREIDEFWKFYDTSDAGENRILTQYFAGLFWSLGIVSKCLEGEIPRTLLQTMFMLLVMLGGFLLFVYICGTLFMISKCDANSVERFDAKVNQLRYVLSYHRVPKEIQERAVEFLENGFKSGDANDRNTIKLLCPSIAKDVKFSLLKGMVSNVPFFKCCNSAFIRALIDLMETQSLPTNFIVCNKGEQGEEMYFVQSGVLGVLINDIKVRELRKGGFFGELSLFTSQLRTANVVTATFCIVHRLSRSHVRRVLRAYPQFESQILACVKSLLEEMDIQSANKVKRASYMRADTVNKRALAYGNFVKKDPSNSSLKGHNKLMLKILPMFGQNHVVPDPDPLSSSIQDSDTPNSDQNIPIWWTRFLLRTSIDRKSRTRLIWLLCVMVRIARYQCMTFLQAATLYNVFTVPLVNTFRLIGYPIQVLTLNTIADAILWLDIYGKLNLSFVEEAEQIMDTYKCAKHYLHSEFHFDFIAAFPWWIFYPSLHLRLRFVRMLRFIQLNEELEEVSLFIRIDSRRRIFVLGLGLFLSYHFAGCMAHSLALVIGYGEKMDGWLPPVTLQLQEIYNSTTNELIGYDYMNGTRFVDLNDHFVNEIILEQYTRALQYGAVCLTNLGRTLEPENVWEYILVFFLMLCGMLLISLIIDEVQKRVTASAIEQMEYLSTRSRILHFLQKQKAPLNIHRRVSAYLDFWWSAHRGSNINELLHELPNNMQREICGFICSPVLDFIQRMDHIGTNIEPVTAILLDNLVIHLYGQGEMIFRKGDYAEAVYILLTGQCGIGHNIRASLSVPMRHLKHGEFFGCSGLHLENENVVYDEEAIARSACVVAMVNRQTLIMLNQAFPSFSSCIITHELQRYGERRTLSKEMDPVELMAIRKKKRFIINPDSNFSTFWETLLFIGMVFQSIGVPYYMAFGFGDENVGPSDTISIFLESCFLIDILLKTRTGYLSYGNKVMDLGKIRHRYLTSFRFLIDVIAVIPMNLINITKSKRSEAWNINKLLRLFKLSSQIEHLERHYFKINIQIRVFKLVFYIYLLSHYVGCTWYNFASNESTIFGFIQDTQFGLNPWLPDKEMDIKNKHTSTLSIYTKAFYWGMGLLLGFEPGKFPETPLEYIFTAFIQTVGVFLLAYVVGNLLDIVQVMEGNNRLFYSNLNYVRKLTKYFGFSGEIMSKIQHFYFYRLFHSIHEEHILTQCLSPSLVADIRLFLLTPMLNKVPFFQDETASSNVTRSLVSQLFQILVTRGEVVCRQNEIGVEMYFIFTGCLEVFVTTNPNCRATGFRDDDYTQKGTKVNELHAGSFFGEKSLFSDQPRNASIEAKTFCTLYRLSRKHLETVFAQHPQWKAKVMQIVSEIYEKQKAKIEHDKQEKERNEMDIKAVEVRSTSMRPFSLTNKTAIVSSIITVLDVLTDIVFLYDIWFKFHVIETIASREFYEHRFIHDRFGLFLDILTILPIDYIFSSYFYNPALLRINRFIKLRQLTHTINEVHRFSMSYEVNRLKLLVLYYFIVCYWTACGYFGLTFVIGFGTLWNTSLPVQYFNASNHMENYDIEFALHQVFRSMYFAATMYTGIGIVYEPHSMIEFIFLFIISVFGIFVMGYVIGEASTLCIYLIQNEVEFKINQMNVMEFLARKNMDSSLQRRVHAYLSYWWSTQQGVAYQSILEQLPPRIRSQAFIQVARMSLARFSTRYIRPLCNDSLGLDLVMHSIAHRLVFEGYPAGEAVIVQGNIGQTMYFVSKGNLTTASTAPNFSPTSYVDGQYFGEEGFLASSFCRYSVVTLRACDLLALSSSDFLQALNEHPRFAECCAISWDAITNHPLTLKDLRGASDIGDFVYSILVRRQSELEYVKATTILKAELMFRHFLRLFVRQMPDSSQNEVELQQGVPIQCQHCEDKTATLYCKFCLQGLCEVCCTHIHESNHFASHLATITKLKVDTPPPKELSQFGIANVVRSWRAIHKKSVAPDSKAIDALVTETVEELSQPSVQVIEQVLQLSPANSLKEAVEDLQRVNSRASTRRISIHKNPFTSSFEPGPTEEATETYKRKMRRASIEEKEIDVANPLPVNLLSI